MMLSLEDLEMEVIIDNYFKEFFFDLYLRLRHLYKDIWNPRIGEDCLKCRYEKGN